MMKINYYYNNPSLIVRIQNIFIQFCLTEYIVFLCMPLLCLHCEWFYYAQDKTEQRICMVNAGLPQFVYVQNALYYINQISFKIVFVSISSFF